MISTVSFSEFCDSFSGSYENNFSYLGKKALFEYLEEYEEETDKEIKLDIVALCCEYTEYRDLKELQENYNDIESMEDLENHTQVILMERMDGTKSDSFIIADY